MIIDAHIHVGAWRHAEFLGRANSVESTLLELTAAGIDGAVFMPSDTHDQPGLLEDMKAAIRGGFTGPLWFFPWIRPVTDDTPGEADLAWVDAHRADITGLKIHPSLSRYRITDDVFRPALELADALDLVVLVHCGRWQEMAGYSIALDAAERWPGVRWLFAHAGGDTPVNAHNAARGVRERGLENVWFEFSGLREYWVIERNVALIGADRYLLGSDFPLAHPRMYLGAIEAMNLSDAEKAAILGENARALFGPPLLSAEPARSLDTPEESTPDESTATERVDTGTQRIDHSPRASGTPEGR